MKKQYSVRGVARLAVEGLPAAKTRVQPYQRVVSGGGDDPGVVGARVARVPRRDRRVLAVLR